MADNTNQAQTRQRILRAATRLFHRHAFQAVGVNAICTEAGVVKGSFYHFFPSKHALLAAVVEEITLKRRSAIQATRDARTNGRETLIALFTQWVEEAELQFNTSGKILGDCVGVLAAELSCHDPECQKLLQTSFIDWHKQLKQLVRDGIADGSIAPAVDPSSTADTLLALLQGLSTMGRTGLPPQRLRESVQLSLKRLLPVPLAA